MDGPTRLMAPLIHPRCKAERLAPLRSQAAPPVRVRLGLSQASAHEHWPDVARRRMLASAVT